MNKKVDPNTKHYFQITSEKYLSQVLREKLEKKNEILATVWEKGQDEKEAEIYTVRSFISDTKNLSLKPTGQLLKTLTGSQKTGKQVLVKIPIDSKTNYFSGGILLFEREHLSYSIQLLQEIFVSQQRSNFRLNANNVIQIQFKMNNKVYDALDISIGGTSIKINKTNSEQLSKDNIFEDCILRFDRTNYHIPKARVSSIMPILDDNGQETDHLKIGLAFLELSESISDELNVKITVEARGDEMKKKFDIIFAKK
jgi:hypothetical protein